jgi:hypothetical protein
MFGCSANAMTATRLNFSGEKLALVTDRGVAQPLSISAAAKPKSKRIPVVESKQRTQWGDTVFI